MKSKRFTLSIKNPCDENWENMENAEDGKFCNFCKKAVIDFTDATEADIARFFAINGSGYCGRFKKNQLEQIYTYSIKDTQRKNSLKYAAAIALGLITTQPCNAQSSNKNPEIIQIDKAKDFIKKQQDSSSKLTTLSIQIKSATDSTSITHCKLLVHSIPKDYTFAAIADSLGRYSTEIPSDDFPLEVSIIGNGHLPTTVTVNEPSADVKVYLSTISDVVMGAPMIENHYKNIYFDFGSEKIRAESIMEINAILQFLLENPNVRLEINAYIDKREQQLYNPKLSQKRASEVKKWFIKKGVALSRITAKGWNSSTQSEYCPDSIECTEYDYQRIRRAEFRLVGKDVDIKSIERFDVQVDPYKGK